MAVKRITSAIAVATYLLATMASGLLHDHHHPAQCVDACHHDGDHDHDSDHDHEPVPAQEDDCLACQYLAQPSRPIPVVELVVSFGIVTELREVVPSAKFDVSLDCPRSRGPPA
jgi:hypothetical protein